MSKTQTVKWHGQNWELLGTFKHWAWLGSLDGSTWRWEIVPIGDLKFLEQAEPSPSCIKNPLEYPFQIHLACKDREEYLAKLRCLVPIDLFGEAPEKTEQPEPTDAEQVALLKTLEIYIETEEPVSQKFYQGLCLKAKDEIDRLTRENTKLKTVCLNSAEYFVMLEKATGVEHGQLKELRETLSNDL